jgi:hypothetical protein
LSSPASARVVVSLPLEPDDPGRLGRDDDVRHVHQDRHPAAELGLGVHLVVCFGTANASAASRTSCPRSIRSQTARAKLWPLSTSSCSRSAATMLLEKCPSRPPTAPSATIAPSAL